MSDLHKPLSAAKPKAPNTIAKWVPLAAITLTLVIALSGFWVFIQNRDSAVQRVAINSEADKPASSSPPPNVDPAREAGQTGPGEGEIGINPDGTLDLSKVKKLSPLLPIDQEDGAADPTPKPAFVPKPVPSNPLSDWVPRPDMVEQSAFGPLPKISPGGIRPLDAYSKSSGLIGANRVAIILGGLGLSQTGSQKAIAELPSSITLGFSPIGNSLQRWMQAARREGHEVVLQLPMEPLGYPAINPGPRTLVSSASEAQNRENLHWAMARMTNYPLVMNYLGAGLGTKPEALRPILAEIRRRGLGYIDDGSAQASRTLTLAQEMGIPNAQGSIVLDGNRNADQIRAKLNNLEALAKARGFAIGTASIFPETVAVVKEWAQQAKRRGILIVPASNLIKDYQR
ncbi:MAG: divergent polysaccharide deacetylase family protein [Pseudomonadota bacterium]